MPTPADQQPRCVRSVTAVAVDQRPATDGASLSARTGRCLVRSTADFAMSVCGLWPDRRDRARSDHAAKTALLPGAVVRRGESVWKAVAVVQRTNRDGGQPGLDFFVSYTGRDEGWASWIAWQLEDAGYCVRFQAWDFNAGTGFVHEMHRAVAQAQRTVAVLSGAYLHSAFAQAEWQAVLAVDPVGERGGLLLFRVEDCERPGLLRQLVSVDLFGVDEPTARRRLLSAAAGKRGKPALPPTFPGTAGLARRLCCRPRQQHRPRRMPPRRCYPTARLLHPRRVHRRSTPSPTPLSNPRPPSSTCCRRHPGAPRR